MSITLDDGTGPAALTGNVLVLKTQIGATGFSNLTANQIAGVADQGEANWNFIGEDGTFFVRFKSNYTSEGKDVAGGFPITKPATTDETSYTAQSSTGLVNGTSYVAMLYWQSPDWDGLGAGTQIPSGNDVVVSSPFTITTATPAPTFISPLTFNIQQGTASGATLGTLVTDVVGATFAEGTPTLGLADVSSSGVVTLAANADTLGNFNLPVTATTSGSYNDTVVITVAEAAGGGDPPPVVADATVSTKTALLAQLDAWEADWAGTIPAGKTSADDRVIAVDTSITGGLVLSGYAFETAGRAKVIIRGAGTFTQDTSTVKITGRVELTSCSGLTLTLFEIIHPAKAIIATTCTDCSIYRCSIKGSASPSITSPPVSSNYGVQFLGTITRCDLTDCQLTYYGICIVTGVSAGCNSTDLQIVGNAADLVTHDFMHQSGGLHTRLVRNWNLYGGRIFEDGSHEDFFQIRNGTIADGQVKYNLHLERARLNGASPNTHQCFFHGSGSIVNGIEITQNFSSASKGGSQFNTVSGANVHRNTCLMSHNTFPPGYTNWASGTDFNVICRATTGSDGGGSGPNGLKLIVGDPANLAVINAELEGSISLTCNLSDIKPLTSSRMHWNHASKTGAYDLMSKIFNSELRWEETGWPTAYKCRTLCNADAGATSSYTGTYDADGNNV